MKKQFFPLSILLIGLIYSSAWAQTAEPDSASNWDVNGNAGLTFSQTSFTNWAGGGENSISGVFQFGLNANYAKGKNSWENRFDVAYGVIKQGDADLIKSDDRWEIASKYGRQINEKWYYTATLNIRSQFAPGYETPAELNKISDLFAPGYIIPTLGIDYKPNKKFSLFMSPVAARFTFVMDKALADAGAFGVDKGENIRTEFGALLRLKYENEIMANVKMLFRTELISNYLEKPQNIVVNSELQLNMRVNKYITTNFSIQAIYDDNIDTIETITNADGTTSPNNKGPKTQIKQIFGAGIAYTF